MHDIDGNNGCGCGCGHHHAAPAGAYDGPDWTNEPDEALVCHCTGVTKGQVVEAIHKGAYTVPLLKIMTGTVHGQDCKQKHPWAHLRSGLGAASQALSKRAPAPGAQRRLRVLIQVQCLITHEASACISIS
jgi:bacterioferritin-associated ferredoxin